MTNKIRNYLIALFLGLLASGGAAYGSWILTKKINPDQIITVPGNINETLVESDYEEIYEQEQTITNPKQPPLPVLEQEFVEIHDPNQEVSVVSYGPNHVAKYGADVKSQSYQEIYRMTDFNRKNEINLIIRNTQIYEINLNTYVDLRVVSFEYMTNKMNLQITGLFKNVYISSEPSYQIYNSLGTLIGSTQAFHNDPRNLQHLPYSSSGQHWPGSSITSNTAWLNSGSFGYFNGPLALASGKYEVRVSIDYAFKTDEFVWLILLTRDGVKFNDNARPYLNFFTTGNISMEQSYQISSQNTWNRLEHHHERFFLDDISKFIANPTIRFRFIVQNTQATPLTYNLNKTAQFLRLNNYDLTGYTKVVSFLINIKYFHEAFYHFTYGPTIGSRWRLQILSLKTIVTYLPVH